MDLVDIILSVGALVAVAAFGLAYWLHRRGVAKADLVPQGVLKVATVADALQDRIVAVVHAEMAKLAERATLRSAYFDKDDFLQDVGRLPANYVQAITLNGDLVRNGDLPAAGYVLQPNGNVVRA